MNSNKEVCKIYYVFKRNLKIKKINMLSGERVDFVNALVIAVGEAYMQDDTKVLRCCLRINSKDHLMMAFDKDVARMQQLLQPGSAISIYNSALKDENTYLFDASTIIVQGEDVAPANE